MVGANSSLQVHITEKRTRPFVTSPHRAPPSQIQIQGNHDPKRFARDFFNSLLKVSKRSACYLLPVLAFSNSFGFGVWLKLNMLLIGLAIVSYEPWPIRWLLSQLSSMKRVIED